MRARGVSEVVGALVLSVIGVIVGVMIADMLAPRVAALEHYSQHSILVVQINSTHALCYSVDPIDSGELRGMGLSVWVFGDVDGDGWNETIPASGVVPPHSYYVVSPPVCG